MEQAKEKRVLITGATGGLGLTLVRTFAESEYDVLATGRKHQLQNRITSYGARFVEADLNNSDVMNELCANQDIVIHAAALSASWGHPEEFQRINVDLTRRLLNAAKEAGVKDFIFISSPSVYASMKDQYNLTEDDEPPRFPLNDYARTKLQAEKLVLSYNSKNFSTMAIRPRALVGPDDNVLLPQIIRMINRGLLPLFRKGQALIELTDVRDAAQAVLLAAAKMDSVAGQVFNISGGRPVQIKDLAEKVALCMKRRVRFIPMPMMLATVLANALETKAIKNNYQTEPPLTRYSLATLAYTQTFDLTNARVKLGYVPSYDGVETILEIARERAG